MEIEEFFDFLLPGDEGLNVPSFRVCDDGDNLSGFLKIIPEYFSKEIKNVGNLDKTPEVLLKELKEKELDLRPVINTLLSFYFSRPAVVKSLTGRPVPLTISGIAEF